MTGVDLFRGDEGDAIHRRTNDHVGHGHGCTRADLLLRPVGEILHTAGQLSREVGDGAVKVRPFAGNVGRRFEDALEFTEERRRLAVIVVSHQRRIALLKIRGGVLGKMGAEVRHDVRGVREGMHPVDAAVVQLHIAVAGTAPPHGLEVTLIQRQPGEISRRGRNTEPGHLQHLGALLELLYPSYLVEEERRCDTDHRGCRQGDGLVIGIETARDDLTAHHPLDLAFGEAGVRAQKLRHIEPTHK